VPHCLHIEFVVDWNEDIEKSVREMKELPFDIVDVIAGAEPGASCLRSSCLCYLRKLISLYFRIATG
jgi:hypothetical protein